MTVALDQQAADALRAEVRSWLAQHWDRKLDPGAWRAQVVDAGWASPSWPEAWYGRGSARALSGIVAEEFARVGAPGGGLDSISSQLPIELHIAGNTILAFGRDSLKRELLRPILLGELRGCLLYSEPGAGSDLAALQTRAERDGDEWVVNGQKIWTTAGHLADFGVLIARTDWDQPKHRGISYFVLPMRQVGVEVRPIRQMTGDAFFNEVFLTDARIPADHLLGDLNDGWRVLQTALAHERLVMGSATGPVRDPRRLPVGARLDLFELARRTGRSTDPVVRQSLADLYARRQVIGWNAARAKAASAGGTSSPAASLGKLAMSRVLHESAALASALLGPAGTLYGPGAPDALEANVSSMMAFMNSIGGGSDQIQRNILSERILGLAKDPATDRDVPFRDVPKAPARRAFGAAAAP
ncbi:MAG TPA: acyl-CoA dehydrogenase family protein [Acidimicrobiales bacterium]|nr:acyl-CoA dehydrogenase family protein [Acidimicrobiales bacterium]